MAETIRLAVDVGGTFTDLVLETPDGTHSHKLLTTPDAPELAVLEGTRAILAAARCPPGAVSLVVHGTTLATNALIERKGARTALVTTEGFRDSLEIAYEHRFEQYDLYMERPEPLVPRRLRLGVPERVAADGEVLRSLDEAALRATAAMLRAERIEAVAICFLHSFTNDAHERRAAAILAEELPGVALSLSCEVAPEIREYERTSTTVANAYVLPLMSGYLGRLESGLREAGIAAPLLLMMSSGGVTTVETARRFPVRLVESGPAGGAILAQAVAAENGLRRVVAFDMGGTTAKLTLIDDYDFQRARSFEVARAYRFIQGSGLPVRIPVIELVEIGAGGGSVARVDSLGLLKVGPDSAGSDPGPVCYGRGGTAPTVTDADLVLGYLDPAYFLGGRMRLDVDGARRAIGEQIAAPLGLSVEEAAWGIHQIANENMANAARVHALERGADPRRLPLFAFGGAGPVHAFRIARALGSPLLLAPLGAGVMSTVGFLSAPLSFDFVRSWPARLDALDWERANRLLAEMEAEGQALLESSGVAPEAIRHRREADMRYLGQGYEIRVPLPDGPLDASQAGALAAAFERVYRELYERPGPPVPIEILSWRVISSGPRPDLRLSVRSQAAGGPETARKGERPAYFPEAGGFVPTPVYDRYRLAPGAAFEGPAIVEERESTVVVGPGARCEVDAQHNLVVEVR